MILFVLRGLARLVSFVLLLALAIFAAAVAVSYVASADGAGWLGDTAHLGEARTWVLERVASLAAPGPIAVLALVCGAGAVLLACLLLVGVLAPRRERMLRADGARHGSLSARRRAVVQAAEAVAASVPEITAASSSVRTRRWRQGWLLVRAVRSPGSGPRPAETRLQEALTPLAELFGLRLTVRSREAAGPDGRVR